MQFWRRLMIGERNENDLKTLDAAVLHCRQAVRVTSHKNNSINGIGGAKVGHVETDTHIDPLLLKIRRKIIVRQCFGRDGNFLGFKAPEFENAASYCK